MKNHFSILVGLLFFCYSSYSQENTQEIKEIHVTFSKLNGHRVDSLHPYLTKKEIELFQADDLGELLQRIPGVNVKSYGGLGGLKTVSVRGLGSQHTQFVIDGFSQQNTQTGQVNLGQIQLDNVESIMVQRGGSSEISIPVSAQLAGNTVLLNSVQSAKMSQKLQLRVAHRIGSFGQQENHLLAKFKIGNWHISSLAKYRSAKGNYSYSIQNYNQTIRGTRQNNDYEDLNLGLSAHFFGKKDLRFNIYGQHLQARQGLPGAVILYNDFSNQRLSNVQTIVKSDLLGKWKKLNYRLYADFSRDSLRYVDPSFLNEHGTLKSSFVTNSFQSGITSSQKIMPKLNLDFGTEMRFSELHSSESLIAKPSRFQNATFLKTTVSFAKALLITQVGMQYFNEKNHHGKSANSVFRINPFIELRQKVAKQYSFNLYYRNAFRMPNFNELYYNNIGNTDLKPEDAHQFSLGNSLTFVENTRIYAGIQINGFYHFIDNMILAIPTKNLFVWSFQNIGKNEIIGGESIFSFSYKWNEKWNTNLMANYTFQHSVDVSDRTSPTYRHQIAYVPKHVVNADWTLNYKQIGIKFSMFYNSKRFALNENILANELAGFALVDFGIFSTINVTKKNQFRFQFTLKNITNQQYAFVRNFVMPGTHFLCSINYAFN